MKKIICVFMVLVCMVTFSYAAKEEESNDTIWINKGTSKEMAQKISSELFGYELSTLVNDKISWFYVQAEQAGEYYINFKSMDCYMSYGVEDENGKSIQGYNLDYSRYSLASRDQLINLYLDAGETIYLCYKAWDSSYWSKGHETAELRISVCFENAHTIGEETYIIKPETCSSHGEYARLCRLCKRMVPQGTINAKGHTLSDWGYFPEATCTTDGVFGQKCSTCGEVMNSMVIPALGHQPGEATVVLQPTTKQPGMMVVQCTMCGDILSNEIIPKLTE